MRTEAEVFQLVCDSAQANAAQEVVHLLAAAIALPPDRADLLRSRRHVDLHPPQRQIRPLHRHRLPAAHILHNAVPSTHTICSETTSSQTSSRVDGLLSRRMLHAHITLQSSHRRHPLGVLARLSRA